MLGVTASLSLDVMMQKVLFTISSSNPTANAVGFHHKGSNLELVMPNPFSVD